MTRIILVLACALGLGALGLTSAPHADAQSCQRDALSSSFGGGSTYTCGGTSMFSSPSSSQTFTVPSSSSSGLILPSPEQSSCTGGSFFATCNNGSRTMSCWGGRDNCSLDPR